MDIISGTRCGSSSSMYEQPVFVKKHTFHANLTARFEDDKGTIAGYEIEFCDDKHTEQLTTGRLISAIKDEELILDNAYIDENNHIRIKKPNGTR